MLRQEFISNGRTTYHFHFDTLAEMSNEACRVYNRYWNPIGDAQFVGRQFNKSMDEAAKAATEIWPDGLNAYGNMIDRLRETEMPRPKSLRRVPRWSEDDGDEIDLDRLRAGQAFWRDTHRQNRPGPMTVTLVTDMATSEFLDSKTIM